jgi:chorismate synthase
MGSVYGKNIRISIFGQSHSEAVGMTLDGIPAGIKLDMEKLSAFMERRAPGRSAHSTKRREPDRVKFLSGLADGVTCGSPLCAVIENTDVRSADYDMLRDLPRPSHGDYTGYVKFGGYGDIRGGGHFSARLTAPLCAAGAVCIQWLESEGIYIGAHLYSVADIRDEPFSLTGVNRDLMRKIASSPFPVIDPEAGGRMTEAIESARLDGDSVGGIVECAVTGLGAGLGCPMFDGAENRIASVIFGIPAVRGIEFGLGFAAAGMRGSRHNDPFAARDGKIVTETNNHGGILGGITSGMPVVFRAAFKPTPSISAPQRTVRLSTMEEEELIVTGRHDPCVAVRAVPVVEAAAALAAADMKLDPISAV